MARMVASAFAPGPLAPISGAMHRARA